MSAWVAVEASDIEKRWRPLTAAETTIAEALIEDAQDLLEQDLEELGMFSAPVPQNERWERAYVRTVANMVRRLLINPEGILEEAGDDGYRYRRDKALSAGALYVADDELNRLSIKRRRHGAFTITPS